MNAWQRSWTAVAVALLLSGWALAGISQEPTPEPGPSRPEVGRTAPRATGMGPFGTIASVGVDRFEIKRMNGEPLTILVNDQTQFREEQKEIFLEDLKPGDRVMVRGRPNESGEIVAVRVRRVSAEEIERFQGSRVFGEIIAISDGELKIRSRRQGERVVVATDQTTVLKQGESITLKDLKVGDLIAVRGNVTDGKFVAERIFTRTFPRGRGRTGVPQ